MHNLQHYRGKDLEWRKSIKKGEKKGRKAVEKKIGRAHV
jgi:hypothetical protein